MRIVRRNRLQIRGPYWSHYVFQMLHDKRRPVFSNYFSLKMHFKPFVVPFVKVGPTGSFIELNPKTKTVICQLLYSYDRRIKGLEDLEEVFGPSGIEDSYFYHSLLRFNPPSKGKGGAV